MHTTYHTYRLKIINYGHMHIKSALTVSKIKDGKMLTFVKYGCILYV